MRSTVLAFLLLSARGGVAALAACLVCKTLRRAHAPSRLLCWLWLAVGLRFVLPWGIPLKLPRPESAPLAAAADTVQELGELPLLPPAPAAAAAAAPLPWYARLTPWHALAAVWLVGVLVLAVRGAVGYLKLKRCVALACNFIFAFLHSNFTANALVYLLMNIGIGVLPYILLFFRIDYDGKLDAHSIPWAICLILSIITFLGLVIFRGRDLKNELVKRLHM